MMARQMSHLDNQIGDVRNTRCGLSTHDFLAYAVQSHGAKWVSRSQVKPSDIVACDWLGGTGKDFDPTHLVIVTKITKKGTILIDSHDTDHLHLPLYGKPGSHSLQGRDHSGKASFAFLQPYRSH
jgi:hypothetical protein